MASEISELGRALQSAFEQSEHEGIARAVARTIEEYDRWLDRRLRAETSISLRPWDPRLLLEDK